MKSSFTSSLFVLLVLALPLSVLALDNKDILKMQKAGLSEDTIVAAIQKERGEFDTGADALIELKSAGVSEKIIQKMIAAQPAVPAGTAPTAPAASNSAPASAVFLQDFPSIVPAKIEPFVGKDYFTRCTRRPRPTATSGSTGRVAS